jgi:hypothetical protein
MHWLPLPPRPQGGQKDFAIEKFQLHHRESNPRPFGLQCSAPTNFTNNLLWKVTIMTLHIIQSSWQMACENETHYLSVTEREAFPYPSFFSSLYLFTHHEIHWVLTDITMKNNVFGDVCNFMQLAAVANPGIFLGGGFNKFSWGQRAARTGIWGW